MFWWNIPYAMVALFFVALCPVTGTGGTPTGAQVRNRQWGSKEKKGCEILCGVRKLFSEGESKETCQILM